MGSPQRAAGRPSHLPDQFEARPLKCEEKPVLSAAGREVKRLHPYGDILRSAIDDTRQKHDAIAALLGVSAPYLSMMLSGEKAVTLRHIDLLPDDTEARFHALSARKFGLVTVAPLSDEEIAPALAGAFLGLLRRAR